MQNKFTAFFLLLIFSVSISLSGQKQVNSPYSRFNIGSLEPAGAFRSQGMGGLGTALRDNASIFFTNPASYSSFDTISFIFDFGFDYSTSILKGVSGKYTSDDMNFDHLMMAFPVAKKIGVALGVLPLSNGYYNMTQKIGPGDDGYTALTGGYEATHRGEGGLSTFFVGAGAEVVKGLSAGINMKVLFGQLNRTNEFIFDDLTNNYHISSSERLRLNGISFDYGLQYVTTLSKNYFIIAGASLSSGKKFNSDYENYSFRYTVFGASDTISYTTGEADKVLIPGTFRAGVSFGKVNKFTAGIEFESTKWSASKIPGSAGNTADSRTLKLGLEYTPEKFSNFSFIKRMDYRLGFHTGSNYLVLDNTQIKEYGVTAGFGIPMRKSWSKTNLFVDYTRRKGPVSTGLNTEDYITAGISINLYDNWFWKPKYE